MLLKVILGKLSSKRLQYLKEVVENALLTKLSYEESSKLLWDHKRYRRKLNKPPFTPSKGDLELYKEFITKNDIAKSNVLLLGSTPLLRKLLQDCGFRNYIIADFSYKAIEGSTEVLKRNGIAIDVDNEIWVKANWLDLPFNDCVFDIILGDLAFTQISPDRQGQFIHKMHKLLKPGGKFVVKMYFSDPSRDNKTVQAVIAEVLDSKNFEDTVERRALLFRRLRDRLRKNGVVEIQDVFTEINKFKTTNDEAQRFLEKILRFEPKRLDLRFPYITQTKPEIEQVIDGIFESVRSKSATDYIDSEFFPVYMLSK